MSPRRAKAVRGRVGDDPAAALRDHLIDTAERLLAERLVTSITTRDIARAAAVSDGVLYNYFADKHDLLLAALLRRHADVIGRFTTDLPQPGTRTVAENLTMYATAALDLLADALPVAAGLIHDPGLLHRFMAGIHTEPFGAHQVQGPLIAYLHGEQELGRVGPVVPEAVFATLFGATVVLALSVMVGGRPREDVVADLPAIVDTVVRGIAP